MKMPKFGTKHTSFGYFCARIFFKNAIFEISTLEFIKNEFLTYTRNFAIGSAFSNDPGFAFSQGPSPGPALGPFYKVCHNKPSNSKSFLIFGCFRSKVS